MWTIPKASEMSLGFEIDLVLAQKDPFLSLLIALPPHMSEPEYPQTRALSLHVDLDLFPDSSCSYSFC